MGLFHMNAATRGDHPLPDSFTVTRTIATTPERLFQAWTTPEEFAAWFGSADVPVPLESVHLDARIGEDWRADMHIPDGPVIHWVGTFTAVEPPHRLALTMTDAPDADPGPPLEITFTAVPGGTEMRVVQSGSGFTPEQEAMTIAGYQRFFDAMEALVTQ